MRIEYHRTLIADQVRNRAFRDALRAVVQPGVTEVADIGAGTGLLGMIAARLGAKRVYLYEVGEIAAVAAQVMKANRARACELIPCHSTEMVDPPKVDVVVTETLGNYALEEDIIETANDALKRHLKPGGVILPSRITQFVAPVVADRFHRELSAWRRVGADLDMAIDLSSAEGLSVNNVYVRRVAVEDLLAGDAAPGGTAGDAAAAGGGRDGAGASSIRVWDTVLLSKPARAARSGEATWALTRSVDIFGFAVWWTAELVPGVALSTAPDAPATHWEQLYFPLAEPLTCAAGEQLTVRLRSRSSREAGTTLAWTALRQDGSGKTLERRVHDLDKGYLP